MFLKMNSFIFELSRIFDNSTIYYNGGYEVSNSIKCILRINEYI